MSPPQKPLSVSTIIRVLIESTSVPILPSAGPESTATGSARTSLTRYHSTLTGAITTVTSGGNTGGVEGTTQKKSTNVGAIAAAGGIVGGVVGLAFIALLGILLFRRRIFLRFVPPSLTNLRQHPDPPPPAYDEIGSTMAISEPLMRFYVRSTCFFLCFVVQFVFRGKAH